MKSPRFMFRVETIDTIEVYFGNDLFEIYADILHYHEGELKWDFNAIDISITPLV